MRCFVLLIFIIGRIWTHKKICGIIPRRNMIFHIVQKNGLWKEIKMLGESIRMTCMRNTIKHMIMMIFEWKISPKMFQNLILRIFSNIGTLKNSRKKRRKATMSCQLKDSLWLQDQENLVEYTRTTTKIQLVKMLKWRNCKVNRVKITINHLMLLQQS